MRYELHDPFQISPALRPAIEVNGVWIEYDEVFIIRKSLSAYRIEVYSPDAAGGGLQFQFADILFSLSAFGSGECPDLVGVVPDWLKRWARDHHDEIAAYGVDIEGEEELLKEVADAK